MLQDVKKATVRHTSLTITRVKLCKWAEVNSEPSHLWYGIFRIDGMQLPVSWEAPASTRTLAQKVLDFLRPSETVYLQIILVTSRTMGNLKLIEINRKYLVASYQLLLAFLLKEKNHEKS